MTRKFDWIDIVAILTFLVGIIAGIHACGMRHP